ncbi:alpha/beta fold hydrolase [Azospirillum sp. sgz302134]
MVHSRNSVLERLNVTVVGTGADVLVLVPGFGTDQGAWRHVVDAFRGAFRIVLLDLVGLGPDDQRHYDTIRYSKLDAYAEDVLAALRELGIRDCAYVGHSVAGMVGVLAAIAEPWMFRKLVLLGSSARYLNDSGYRGGFEAADVNAMIDAATADYIAWTENFGQLVVSAPPGDPTVREFVANLRAMRPDVALSILLTIFYGDLRDRLSKVAVPAVVLQTANDAAVPLEAAEHLRDHLPGGVMEVLEAAGHFPHMTAPDMVIEALSRHL